MKILLIKTSSMGDVIHALPALQDAKRAIPHLTIDWVVEERFACIARWSSCVNRVIPVGLRRWRKAGLLKSLRGAEFKAFKTEISREQYDLIIDAQGLLKSALLARLAKGERCGYDRKSIREPLASFFYDKTFPVSRKLHAVTRIRELFAKALGYAMPQTAADYGLNISDFGSDQENSSPVILIHGTTWESKHWPERYWIHLVRILAEKAQVPVQIAWGSGVERARAKRLAQGLSGVQVMPDLDIEGMANALAGARAVVAVDTGFAHLAEALSVPLVALYGPTSPDLCGPSSHPKGVISAEFPACAPCHKRICSYKGHSSVRPACFERSTPERVFEALKSLWHNPDSQ